VRQSTLLSEAKLHQDAIAAIVLKATGSLETWRQTIEGEMDDLKLKMAKLTKYMDRYYHSRLFFFSGNNTISA
jgi:hypothetical protein